MHNSHRAGLRRFLCIIGFLTSAPPVLAGLLAPSLSYPSDIAVGVSVANVDQLDAAYQARTERDWGYAMVSAAEQALRKHIPEARVSTYLTVASEPYPAPPLLPQCRYHVLRIKAETCEVGWISKDIGICLDIWLKEVDGSSKVLDHSRFECADLSSRCVAAKVTSYVMSISVRRKSR